MTAKKSVNLQSKGGQDAPIPSISFSEDEVKEVAEFVNYIIKNAYWDHSTVEALKLGRMIKKMDDHIKKIDGYVLEVKKVYNAKGSS